jgi:hypothetical protein
MDILLTMVASVLMIIGFFVICRTSDDEDEQELDEETNAADEAQEQIIESETNRQTTEHETSSHGSNTPDS